MTLRRTGVALLAGGTVVLAVCALVIRANRIDQVRRLSARAVFFRALGALRPVPGRVSGLAYAPYPTTLPAFLEPSRRDAIRVAARRIAQEPTKPPRASARTDRALVRLAAGNLPGALQDLEEAARLAPVDGRLQSDLSALRLEQANRGVPQAYLEALTAAHTAVELAPDFLPARFNLSLALERNGLCDRAQEAWVDYLRHDPASSWAAEARRHLALVEQPDDAQRWERLREGVAAAAARGDMALLLRISRRFPSEARKYAEEDLLNRWAVATTRGDRHGAALALEMARALGQAVAAKSSERMAHDAVSVLDRLEGEAAAGHNRLLRLARAQQDLASGEQLCLNQGAGGTFRLERARAAFAEAGSPLENWASYYLAVCSYEHAHYATALARLRSLLARPHAARYPSLAGKAYYLVGLCYVTSGRPDLSLGAYQSAAVVFRRSGAVDEAGHVAYLLSENLRYLGERRASLRLLLTAVAAAVKSGDSRALYRAFDGLAEEAARRGAGRAALDFRDQVLRVAQRATERPELQQAGLAHAWLRRGEARLAIGDAVGARQDLAVAASHVEQIADPDARRLREADLLLAQGRLLLTTDPRAALRHLSTAVREKIKAQSLFFLLEALHTRARAELALRDRGAAAADVAAGLREFEQQRGAVVSLSLRASYLDRVEELFVLAITPGGSDAGFALAERERARSMLDLTASPEVAAATASDEPVAATADPPTARAPLPVASLRHRLPDGIVLVEYAVLPDRVLAWLLRRGRAATLIESRVGAREMTSLVGQLRQGLESRGPERHIDQVVAPLSEALLGPTLPFVHKGEALVFVPDRTLRNLPFAALRDPRTHRYLIEEHPVAVAPSATLFVEGLERDLARRRGPKLDALVLGNPSFDRRLSPDLPELPGAASEATAVAAVYGHRTELRLGSAATALALVGNAGKHRVVHVAAHALANPDFPSLSRLVLAPSGHDEGNLYAYEIERRRFRDTRLVVLAACGSGSGGSEVSEGADSLAWAFLAAGVPAVVASLWNVEDLDAGRLLTEFHRRFRASGDAPGALRAAQLAFLRGPDPALRSPTTWASFELLGGLAVPPQRP
jgi:CHAT domain-containing protein